MQMLLKMLTGKTIVLTVEPSDTIKAVKQKIQDAYDIPFAHQNIIVLGKVAADESTVSEHKIHSLACIHLVVRASSAGA